MSCLSVFSYGDIGTVIRGTIYDEAGAVQNISDATVKRFIFKKADGTVIQRSGSFYTDGSDGKIQYTTVSGDLNSAGRWRVQPYVETPDGSWTGDTEEFFVENTLLSQ